MPADYSSHETMNTIMGCAVVKAEKQKGIKTPRVALHFA